MNMNESVTGLLHRPSNNLMKVSEVPRILLWDIRNFVESNDEMMVPDMGREFCNKWAGYKKDYGESRIQEIIETGTWRQAGR
jgi:hypothetical protein